MSLPRTVALVGRPNVGKSRLFNRLARKRVAIVHDQAGVTRDVNAIRVDNDYMLLDTGGIGLVPEMSLKALVSAAEEQVWLALETAGLICFVVDAREGFTSMDEVIAERLRQANKPVLLVVNKVDGEEHVDRVDDFSRLGFAKEVMVSAEHGYNEEELREAIFGIIGPAPEKVIDPVEAAKGERVSIAFVGRPNVGKSSLCNALLEAERMVVSEVPGTTRDSVELDLDYHTKSGNSWPFRLIDTAGLRRKGRLDSPVEYFSTLRTRDAIERADIVFLVIDAEEGVSKQDKQLAGEVVDSGKLVAVVINKWDLAMEKFNEAESEAEGVTGYKDEREFREKYAAAALKELFFLPDSPVLFVSAKTGYANERILRTARGLWEKSARQLPTPKLNQLIDRLQKAREPRVIGGKRFRIYYAVQVDNRPFLFRLFCNRATKLEDSYYRYLRNAIMREFDLAGCPIKFDLRGKEVRYAKP
ncbi:MAG: ribosome biogenesis GTPase Der [Verrucomicrobiota bacterium JB022]|nr:ribosome biogenesis GTPase Der [Verrucomicrobiota bacterium JB022]